MLVNCDIPVRILNNQAKNVLEIVASTIPYMSCGDEIAKTEIYVSKWWHLYGMPNTQTKNVSINRGISMRMQNSRIKKCVGIWWHQLDNSLGTVRHAVCKSNRGHRLFWDVFVCVWMKHMWSPKCWIANVTLLLMRHWWQEWRLTDMVDLVSLTWNWDNGIDF